MLDNFEAIEEKVYKVVKHELSFCSRSHQCLKASMRSMQRLCEFRIPLSTNKSSSFNRQIKHRKQHISRGKKTCLNVPVTCICSNQHVA